MLGKMVNYIKGRDLTVSAYDHGFLYGLGFFETFRTYEGQLFLWDEHWSRLSRALADFRITMPYDKRNDCFSCERVDESE